jgi:hypothetical protein
MQAGKQRAPRRDANRTARVGALHVEPARGEAVEKGRAQLGVAVDAEGVEALLIRRDQEDVGLFSAMGVRL